MMLLGMFAAGGGGDAAVQPIVDSVTPTAFTSTTTSHNVQMPATVNAGDLLIMQFVYGGISAAPTTPAGWQLASFRAAGTTRSIYIYTRVASGTEGGSTVDLVTSSSVRGAALVYRIRAGTFSTVWDIDCGSSTGSSAAPQSPRIRSSITDDQKLFISMFGGDYTQTVLTPPTDYLNTQEIGGASAGNHVAVSTRRYLTAGDHTPGAYSVNASATWVAETVVVYPPTRPAWTGANVISVTETSFNGNTTDHQVAMPATVANGDRLVCGFVNDGGATVTTPSGWSLLASSANNTNVRLSWYYRDADGTEGGTTVNFVTSAAEHAAAQVFRIEAGTFHSSAPEITASTTSTNTAPVSGAITASWADSLQTLFISSFGCNEGQAVTSYPERFNWNRTNTLSAAGTGDQCAMGSAVRRMTFNSDAPEAFAIGTSRAWVAFSIAIRPAA